MSLNVQNLRAVSTGVEPASLLPGQIAFNVVDKVIYVGDGSNNKTNFDGTQVPGVPAAGWYSQPMDFDSLGEYFVPNPGYWGDTPTDQQVLTWSNALNHPIWTTGGGGGGGSQVYVVTNSAVASASGSTTSDKISSAIGVVSPDEGDVTIVTGLPDDVYEGLYFFTTEWVRGASYAYPSATEVIYNNTAHPSLGPTVQGAIDDLDDGLVATTAIANTANSTANSALSIANAALPRTGGTMTGSLTTQNIITQPGFTIQFANGVNGALSAISDSTSVVSSTTAASSSAVKSAYDLAAAAIPRASYTAGGDLLVGTGAGTFAPLTQGPANYLLASSAPGTLQWVPQSEGDVTTVSGTAPIVVDNADPQNPVVSVDLATTATPGVVQIELTGNINIVGGVINVPDASTSVKGAVQLYNSTSGGTSSLALTAAAGASLQSQIDALTLSNSVILAGGYDATTGLVDGVTSQGTAAGYADGVAPPTPSATNVDHYLIATVAGNIPATMQNGDWLLSVETSPGVYAYQVLGVGARPASASYTQAGIVQLADAASVLAGTSDTTAITPQALQDNVIDSVTTTNSSLIASATAVKTTYDVAAAAIPCAAVTGKGAILTGSASGTPAALPVGSNGQVLIANSACATGLEWVSDTPGDVTSVSGTAPITVDNTNPQTPVVGINAASTTACGAVQLNDTVTSISTSQAATASAVKIAYDLAAVAVPCNSFSALGQLLVGTSGGAYSALNVGVNGQVLLANSACATGLEWCTLSLACVPCSAYTAVGTILAGNGAGTYCSLSAGTNGQILVPNSACAAGVEWVTRSALSICGYTCAATPFNTALGANAGDSITTGTDNVAIGYNAGTAQAAGTQSVFVGSGAGQNTNAVGVTAIGFCAGQANIGGGGLTYIGWVSGRSATGGCNTYVGSNTGAGALNTSSCGTLLGWCAGGCLTSGSGNTLVGFQSGRFITTGANNVAIGTASLQTATTAASNVAVGCGALSGLSTSAGNTAVGHRAMLNASTAANNVAIGCNAGEQLSTGSNNVLIGDSAGDTITTGTQNTFVGSGSGGVAATTSEGNTGIGFSALGQGVVSGAYNVALGNSAGQNVTSGALNTLVGYTAGSAITTGGSNTLVGRYTGTSTLANNVVLSDGAGTIRFQSNSTGAISLGTGGSYGTAGQFLASQGSAATPVWCTLSLACVPCSAFTAAGQLLAGTGTSTFSALTVGTNGQFLSANSACSAGLEWCTLSLACVPCSAFTGSGQLLTGTGTSTFTTLPTGTNGQILAVDTACTGGLKWLTAQGTNICGFTCSATPFNTAVGSGAGAALTNLSVANTAIGYFALDAETTGDFNVAIGHNALTAQNGASGNTVIGGNAGAQVTSGSNNTLVGCGAGDVLTTGSLNLAVGPNALGALTTGSCNVAIGSNSLLGVTTVNLLTAIGTNALCGNTTGLQNTGVGFSALSTNTTGSNNTALGYRAGVALSGSNNTLVGNNAGATLGIASCNTLVGNCAGVNLTTGSCNTLIGGYNGTTTLSNNVVLSDGAGNIKLQVNENGAVGVGTTPGYGTAGQILVSGGSGAAPTWTTSAAVPANYGSFLRTTTQTNLDTTNGNAAIFDTTVASNNFSVVGGTQITAAVAGTYSIVATYQVSKTNSGTDDVNVWFKKNGTNVPNSAFNLTLVGNNAAQLATTPWIITLAAGDQIEAWWWSADANAILLGEPASAPYPAIPSVNLVIMPVGA